MKIKKATQKEDSTRKVSKVLASGDERKTKKHSQSKVLYNQKFSAPLRKKRKNEYDPDEEARYEMQK